jgi:D-sedoheptulose 7-phosphate isomerase
MSKVAEMSGRNKSGTSTEKSVLQTDVFEAAVKDHQEVVRGLLQQRPVLERIATAMLKAISRGNKVLWCGNGGSAADAQHLAAELVGRFRRDRRGLASLALTTNTSILTAVSNDYGYDDVFRRQVEALCVAGDVVVGITTSGASSNVCRALQAARELGAFTVAFTGQNGGVAADAADECLRVPSGDTARVQEAHILCGHMLCDWIERSVPDAAVTGKGAAQR